MVYARGVPEDQRFPNLLRESIGFVSFPVPRRFPRRHWTVASPGMLPSPLLHRLGNRIVRPIRTGLNSVTRLQNSLYATTRSPDLPCTGQDVYDRAFAADVATQQRRLSLSGFQSIPAAGLPPARLAALWAASKRTQHGVFDAGLSEAYAPLVELEPRPENPQRSVQLRSIFPVCPAKLPEVAFRCPHICQ